MPLFTRNTAFQLITWVQRLHPQIPVRGAGDDRRMAREPIPAGNCTETAVLARRRILCTYPENVLMGPLAAGEQLAFADRLDASHQRLAERKYQAPAG